MEFVWVVAIVLACLIVCCLTVFSIRRLRMVCRLKAACRATGAVLTGTRPFWFFGCRRGRSNDFYLENGGIRFSVKLFPVNSRRSVLLFSDDTHYFFRKYMAFVGPNGTQATLSSDSKRRPIPDYDFRKGFREDWEKDELIPVLLVHPNRFDIVYTVSGDRARAVDADEKIHGMAVMQLSDLIRRVKEISNDYGAE